MHGVPLRLARAVLRCRVCGHLGCWLAGHEARCSSTPACTDTARHGAYLEELKAFLGKNHIDASGCVEKAELVSRGIARGCSCVLRWGRLPWLPDHFAAESGRIPWPIWLDVRVRQLAGKPQVASGPEVPGSLPRCLTSPAGGGAFRVQRRRPIIARRRERCRTYREVFGTQQRSTAHAAPTIG